MKMSIGKIRTNNFNPNEMSIEKYESFKDSVAKFGMKDPIKIGSKDSQFEIINGEHRFKYSADPL